MSSVPGCLGCLGVLAVAGTVGFVACVGEPDPPFDYEATVAVEEPRQAEESAPHEGSAGGRAEVDQTDPQEVLRDSVAASVEHWAHSLLGLEDVHAECEGEVRGPNGTLECVAAYQDLEMDYEVSISERAEGDGFIEWYQHIAEPADVIVVEEAVHRAFWGHTQGYHRRYDDLEQRCDALPENPFLSAVDELREYQCYLNRPGWFDRTYTLSFENEMGGYHFYDREE